ncbi:Histone-lysine N-methyltransferase SETMAR-like [Oopsacas minuta]|uniref:Histone-lysine N-methyltransferase SETMAR-like n=1 Tax=Oopsacas minuta TaxID=111878 RepID=A0AAV7JIC5_9METZ|nr:Histone-lysine N-methyltransferase SETMAR-like [Oopsacas minuta]
MYCGLRILHDDARPYKTKLFREELGAMKIGELGHPPYSPSLASCDFWLFPKLKKNLSGRKFESQAQIGSAIFQYMKEESEESFIISKRNVFRIGQKINQFNIMIDSIRMKVTEPVSQKNCRFYLSTLLLPWNNHRFLREKGKKVDQETIRVVETFYQDDEFTHKILRRKDYVSIACNIHV